MNLDVPSLNAPLREFLTFEVDVAPSKTGFISHSCRRSNRSIPEWWEYVCRKLDFLLEICHVLGDQQLTAKVNEAYGARLCQRSLLKLEDVEDASSLKLLLIEGTEVITCSKNLRPEYVTRILSFATYID